MTSELASTKCEEKGRPKMKMPVIKGIILSLCCAMGASYAQTNVKTWTETTVQDFSDNQLDNVVIANNAGGEVELRNPLVRKAEDHVDNSIQRFVAKDSAGNFVKTWVHERKVFFQKYSSEGTELTGPIQANVESASSSSPRSSRAALFNDGNFIVVWSIGESLCGQNYRDDSVKVGSGFQIQNFAPFDAPAVLANETDGSFWVLSYPEGKTNIHFQRIDKYANTIQGLRELNPGATFWEWVPALVHTGSAIYVVWHTAIGIYETDVYLGKYSHDAVALGPPMKINDVSTMNAYGNLDLCVDKRNHLLIVWEDSRCSDDNVWRTNIYGQLIDSAGLKIGNNIRLENSTSGLNLSPDIESIQDGFQLSWIVSGIEDIHVNKWRLEPLSYGEMISYPFYVGPSGANFHRISWIRTSRQQTDVSFRLRTAATIEQLNGSSWYGPFGTADYYREYAGQEINPIHNGDRYIQYKAVLTSEDVASPILNSVSIEYTTLDSLPPSPPSSLVATSSHSHLTLSWQPNLESDLAGYALYRGTKSGTYDNHWRMAFPKGTTSAEDTTAKTGVTYFYVITSVDSNRNESTYSNETTGAALAFNFYVSPDGSSSGNGSIDLPFKTIKQGIDAAVSGDTVRVLAGTYNESFTIKNGVSLIGAGADRTEITTLIIASDNCVTKGFTFTAGLRCSSTSPIIAENIFRGSPSSWVPAISLEDSSHPSISKNFITECGVGIGILEGCKPTISNNIIYSNEAGIQIDYTSKPIIRNNTIIAKGLAGPLELTSFDSVAVENNIAMTLRQDNGNTYPSNLDDPRYTIRYNDFWNSYRSGTQVRPTNLFLDPQFVNLELQDYHLLPTSPCINAGNPDPSFNDVDGSRNDIGAYGGPDPIKPFLSSQLTKSISVSSLSAYPGDTISVLISVDNSAGLAKASFSLRYDESLLTFSQAMTTQATENFILQTHSLAGNEIGFSLSSNTAAQAGQKGILGVRFAVNANSKTNDASPLTLMNVSLLDANSREINLRSVANGAVVVNWIVEGENYLYVDGGNEGSEDGSRRHPFNTIMEAVNVAVAGDTILVSGGDYRETLTMKEGISLIGSGPSVTFLTVTGDQVAITFDHNNAAELSGFTVRGDEDLHLDPLILCESSSPVIKKNRVEAGKGSPFAIRYSNMSSGTIEQNYIKGGGIEVVTSNPLVRGNVIEGAFVAAAILCTEGAAPFIMNNIIEGAVVSWAVSVNNAKPTLRNNYIYCNGGGFGVELTNASKCGIFNNIIKDRSLGGTGIVLTNSSGNEIINNTIITYGKGIEEQNSTSTVLNNIVVNSNSFGVQLSSSSNHDYNDVWNNVVNYKGTSPGANDLSVDPLFVDTASEDYRLSTTSLCIDAGNPNVKYNDNDGSRNDIGAFGGPYADSAWTHADRRSLALDSVTASLRDTVQVTITGEGMKGVTGIDVTISFDPSMLQIINASSGDAARSFSLARTALDFGTVNLSLKSSKGITADAGELIKLSIAVQANQLYDTFLEFDSAKVTDEATYTRAISHLRGGRISIISGVKVLDNKTVPNTFVLYQNYPNPFNPTTRIRYEIPRETNVSMKIYDVLGREVVTLVDGPQKPGRYEIDWNAGKYATGVYFYRLRADPFVATKKLLLVK
jgi:parallel beta-helix repeat protein